MLPRGTTYIMWSPFTPGGSYSRASSKPRSCNLPTLVSPYASICWREPKRIDPVGHAFTHAGSRPPATRSTHIVHLYTFLAGSSKRGLSNGQAGHRGGT